MTRPRIATLASTYGALALAVAFVLATISVVTHVSEQQQSVEHGARCVRRLAEVAAAVRALAHHALDLDGKLSDEEESRRFDALVQRCVDARHGADGERLEGCDVAPMLREVDARLAAIRTAWPALLRARHEPEATLREAQRLDADAEAADAAVEEAIARVRGRLTELSVEMRDSTRRISELLIIACFVAALVAVLLLLRQRDVARLFEAQRARIALDERLNLLLKDAPVVLWSTDRDLRFDSSHGAALSGLGLKPGELDGRTLAEFFGTQDPEFLPIARHRAALAGEPQRYEIQWAARDFFVQLVPRREGKGAPVGVLGSAIDVTEPKEAERALAGSNARVRHLEKMEAVGRLADTVAHDFNNFLTVILGNAGLALNALPADAPVRSEIDEIARTAERAAQLTRQLLAFGRPQSFAPEAVDLNHVVRGLERILRRQCGEEIELVLELDREPVAVDAHPAQMEQIVLNLALNARDAMPSGGRLTIATSRKGPREGFVTLSIRDTGVGMDEEVRRRLFEPFFTTKLGGKLGGNSAGKLSGESGPQGTGLGLAIVDAIVRERGGSINVESAIGRGSTFHVQIPVARGALPDAAPDSPDAVPPGRGETILLVEDDEAVRSLARRALEAHGYSVAEARGGDDAIEFLAQRDRPVDLLLTDLRMPRMSGDALARWCRAANKVGRVVVMSTHPEAEEVSASACGTEAAFLAKPFTSSELLRRVRETLDRPLA